MRTYQTIYPLICVVLSITMACSPMQSHEDRGYQGEKSLCNLEVQSSKASWSFIQEHDLRRQLNTEGLTGWVHGALPEQGLFVFTWRDPEDFFTNMQIPMYAPTGELGQQLSEFNRHDRVRVRGDFSAPNSPLPHIQVSGLDMEKAYEGPEVSQVAPAPGPLPDEILQGSEMVAQVHAMLDGGSVLIVEREGRVIPLFNPRPELASNLYRNDKIFIKYVVRRLPGEPVHLEIDQARPLPLEVVNQIACQSGEDIELEGRLVMFPQSPQINRNIFALRWEDGEGVIQNYTFIDPHMNTPEGIENFMKMNQKLQKAWDEMADTAEQQGNILWNPRLRVWARGQKHVVSPFQANPQIRIDELRVKKTLWSQN